MRDRGISEIVGSVLTAALLVSIAGGLTVYLVQEHRPVESLPTSFVPESDETSLRVLHQGGPSVPTSVSTLHVTGDGLDTAYPLATFSDQIGDAWDVGEALCLAGADASCADTFRGQTLTSVRLVHDGVVEYEWTGLVVAPMASPAGPSHAPDLQVTFDGVAPSTPIDGAPAVFSVTLVNDGTADVPLGTTIHVDFDVDGVVFDRQTVPGPLLVGVPVVVTSDPWSATGGAHTAGVTADPDDTIAESDETDNTDSLAFTVAYVPVFDPGHAYEDTNCDGLYTDGVDIPIPDEDVTDGSHTVSDPTYGLVIPASVGAISGDGQANAFVAGNGCHLMIAAMFHADNSDTSLVAGTDVYLFGDLTADGTELTINAVGDVVMDGVTISHDTSVVTVDTDGDLRIVDSHITCDRATVTLLAAGSIILDGTTFQCHRATFVAAAGSSMSWVGTTLKNERGTHDLDAGGDIDLTNARFLVDRTDLVFTTDLASRTIQVGGATFDDRNDVAKAEPSGVAIAGTPAAGSIDHVG